MRHRKIRSKLNRTTGHRTSLICNMMKSFLIKGRIETTPAKARFLRREVEPLITLSKEDTLVNRRSVLQRLHLRYNQLSPKERKKIKQGNDSVFNDDRKILKILFSQIGPKYRSRPGGYLRIVRKGLERVGDAAGCCIVQYV